MVSSGVRIGTPALAARGFGVADFAEVADVIAAALRPATGDDASSPDCVAGSPRSPLATRCTRTLGSPI